MDLVAQERMPRRGAAGPRVFLTARDAELIGWLVRYGYATTPILCRRFGASDHKMRWRVRRLVSVGLLRAETNHRPRIVVPTADGVDFVSSPLSVPSVSVVRVRHSLGVALLGCEAELAGLRTWAEREVRVADRGRSRLSLSVHLPSAVKSRRAGWHVPDLVVAHPSASGGAPLLEAVELELTFKSAARLRDILMAYAASPLFTRVTYYTWSRGITVAVEDAAAAISLHARQLVRVRPFPGRDYGNVELTRGTADILDARALRWTPNS